MKCLLLLLFFCSSVTAKIFDEVFQPTVTIHKKKSNADLKMKVLPSQTLTTPYVVGKGFSDMFFDIEVSSSRGDLINYEVKLLTSQHYCKEQGRASQELAGVELYTNERKFDFNSLLVFKNTVKNKSSFKVMFPNIPTKAVSQVCYGTFIITAESKL